MNNMIANIGHGLMLRSKALFTYLMDAKYRELGA